MAPLLTALVVHGSASASSPPPRPWPRPAPIIEVATYNLYLGADLSPLFEATDPAALLQAAPAVWAGVNASRPAERMVAVARVLARERPDVVGLQEVALWETGPYSFQPTPAGPVPVPAGPFSPAHDFLALLLDALAERGSPYEAVAVQRNFTSEVLPFAVPVSEGEAVRFTDRDVILVRRAALRRLSPSNEDGASYTARFTTVVGGLPLEVVRGWASVDLTVRDRTFRVFNTHLEAFGREPLRDEFRNPQAAELAARVTASPHPAVVLGDINARPTMCQDARRPPLPEDANVVAYAALEEAGLREVWPLTNPRRPCHPTSWTSGVDLTGPDTRTHRIDHIFIDSSFRALRSEVVGDEGWERSRPSGLWPSDHAGATAVIKLDGGALHHRVV